VSEFAPARAVRVARSLAHDRLRYPALRLRSTTQVSPGELLVELGFDPDSVASVTAQYDAIAPWLFGAMLERAEQLGGAEPLRKLRDPYLPTHDSKRLVYAAVRLLQPDVVVETGTYNGNTTTFVLQALEDNCRGRLASLDLPAYQPIPNAVGTALPAGQEPGWIVPDRLRGRLEIVLGDARATLPEVLEREGRIDFFIHDSLHTARHMLFEYRRAWESLRPGGLLMSDDIFMTHAYWWFLRRRKLPFRHIGNVGLVRKPRA
jgi:predicted O-methyltransferase YrrM